MRTHPVAVPEALQVGFDFGQGRESQCQRDLVVFLVLMLLGALPAWPHSRNWGCGPSGGLGLVLAILVVLVLMGRI